MSLWLAIAALVACVAGGVWAIRAWRKRKRWYFILGGVLLFLLSVAFAGYVALTLIFIAAI